MVYRLHGPILQAAAVRHQTLFQAVHRLIMRAVVRKLRSIKLRQPVLLLHSTATHLIRLIQIALALDRINQFPVFLPI